jgi:rhodanese-related sulfurtransferase
MCSGLTVDELLQAVRGRLDRLDPYEARDAVAAGAVLVDIRPALNRELEGEIPGAVVVERNVLEWRFDPRSPDRLPEAATDARLILVCNEGYASSLAAASLHDLGVHGATDLVGGYRAWRAAGLPVTQIRKNHDVTTAVFPHQ